MKPRQSEMFWPERGAVPHIVARVIGRAVRRGLVITVRIQVIAHIESFGMTESSHRDPGKKARTT